MNYICDDNIVKKMFDLDKIRDLFNIYESDLKSNKFNYLANRSDCINNHFINFIMVCLNFPVLEYMDYIPTNCFQYIPGELIIPNTINKMEIFAFDDCHGLTNIVIPNSIEYIPYRCFYRCYDLKSVYIPSSVEFIEGDAFVLCSKIKDVYYEGTEDEFENILDEGNEHLLEATFHQI